MVRLPSIWSYVPQPFEDFLRGPGSFETGPDVAGDEVYYVEVPLETEDGGVTSTTTREPPMSIRYNGQEETSPLPPPRLTGWTMQVLGGDVYVVPVTRSHAHAAWSYAGSRGGYYQNNQAFEDKDVSATEAEALSRARVAVGLAKVDFPSNFARSDMQQETREALRRQYEIAVKDELRVQLRPVIEERMMLQAERAAFAREKETKTMARAELNDDEETSPTLLDKAKAVGSKAVQTVKTDAQKAAIRSVARQIVSGARKALLRFLEDKGVGEKARGPIEEIIDSDVGKMAIGYTLGTLVPLMPGLAGRPIVIAAGEELRVEAMSLGSDAILDGLVAYVFPDVMKSVKALEEATGDDPFTAAAKKSVQEADFVPTSS